MRSGIRVAAIAALIVFADFGGRIAVAQSEVNPDHFDSPNSEPLETRIEGNASPKPTPIRDNAHSKQPDCGQCTSQASESRRNQASSPARGQPRQIKLIQKSTAATDPVRQLETSLRQ